MGKHYGLDVSTFLALADTPAAYAGQADKLPHVNATEDALAFTPWKVFSATKIFDGQTASPPTYYLQAITTFPNINPADSGGKMHRCCAIGIGGNIYVGGGRYFNTGIYNNQWWKYNIATEKWTKLANLPDNYGFSVNWRDCIGFYNGKIYLRAEYKENSYTNALLEYNIAGDSWDAYASFGTGATHHYILAACTDALYLAVDTEFKKWDYGLHSWTDLTALPSTPLAGGIIGDEVYAVVGTATYKYNKGTTNWDDQVQAAPAILGGAGGYVEDMDAVWALNRTTSIVYRYTPAGGWVAQFTYARDSWEWGYMIQFTGESKVYCFFDDTETHSGFDDLVACGSIHLYNPDSLVWEIYAATFTAGDFLVIDTGQVPIVCEKDGLLKFTATGLSAFFIMETGRYLITLSKDYTFANTKLWKSVWG